MGMNLKFDAAVVSEEAKHTEEEKTPNVPCDQYHQSTEREGFSCFSPVAAAHSQNARAFKHLYLRILQEMTAEYKEEKMLKYIFLLTKPDSFQLFEGTISKHTSMEISQKSLFLITVELVQTAPKPFWYFLSS